MPEVEVQPRLQPLNSEIILVESREALELAAKTLSEANGPFALDAERASGFKYSQRAYLVQVTRENAPIYLIDPIELLAESPDALDSLKLVLGTGEWILHAAAQDLPCLHELGFKPKSIFDTELAGRLLGMPRVGLGALCEEWLNVSLAKEHSAVDWSTRPLRQEWLNYAALDVDVLIELRLKALSLLEESNKLSWANEEFERLLSFQPKPQKADKWRSMSGLHEIKDQRSLAIAKELWSSRENLAIKMDVSPGRLIPDSAIVAAAKDQPKSRSALAGLKTFTGRASRTYLDTWWQALVVGSETLQMPELKPKFEGIPSHRNWEARHPEAHERLQAARPKVLEIAEKNNLPIENLLQPDLLRQLCWEPPVEITQESIETFLMAGGARKWQVGLVCEELVSALKADKTPVV